MRRLSKILLTLFLWCTLLPALAAGKPVIIDSDLNIDDVIAILYLLKNPAIDVRAISIETLGLHYCAAAVRNTAGILRLAQQDAIPIGCGPESHLALKQRYYAHMIQRILTLSGTANLLPVANKKYISAVDLLLKTLRASHQPVTILAIGQLTNLAAALRRDPSIKTSIREIVIMGGAIHLAGNVSENGSGIANNISEWNLYIDALAAKNVFSAGIPIRLISLDATNALPIDEKFYQTLKKSHASATADYVYEILRKNHDIISSREWYFWDPAAAVLLTDPQLASWRQQSLRVSINQAEAGRLVVDTDRGQAVSVCQKVYKTRFERHLLETIG